MCNVHESVGCAGICEKSSQYAVDFWLRIGYTLLQRQY